jgi:hypothetical protein
MLTSPANPWVTGYGFLSVKRLTNGIANLRAMGEAVYSLRSYHIRCSKSVKPRMTMFRTSDKSLIMNSYDE